jgi:hypothetical protein
LAAIAHRTIRQVDGGRVPALVGARGSRDESYINAIMATRRSGTPISRTPRISSPLLTMAAHEELFQSTVLFITVDEGGGMFDSGYIQPLDFFGDGPRTPLITVHPRRPCQPHVYGSRFDSEIHRAQLEAESTHRTQPRQPPQPKILRRQSLCTEEFTRDRRPIRPVRFRSWSRSLEFGRPVRLFANFDQRCSSNLAPATPTVRSAPRIPVAIADLNSLAA